MILFINKGKVFVSSFFYVGIEGLGFLGLGRENIRKACKQMAGKHSKKLAGIESISTTFHIINYLKKTFEFRERPSMQCNPFAGRVGGAGKHSKILSNQ